MSFIMRETQQSELHQFSSIKPTKFQKFDNTFSWWGYKKTSLSYIQVVVKKGNLAITNRITEAPIFFFFK